jgi:ABC-type lipoprotein release transport system permease subunit
MAKKVNKKSKNQFSFSWKLIAYTSIVVNIIFILCSVSIMVFYKDGQFDLMMGSEGHSRICSDRLRTNVENYYKDEEKLSQKEINTKLAYLDYMCQNQGSDTYYQEGLTKYKASLGL